MKEIAIQFVENRWRLRIQYIAATWHGTHPFTFIYFHLLSFLPRAWPPQSSFLHFQCWRLSNVTGFWSTIQLYFFLRSSPSPPPLPTPKVRHVFLPPPFIFLEFPNKEEVGVGRKLPAHYSSLLLVAKSRSLWGSGKGTCGQFD